MQECVLRDPGPEGKDQLRISRVGSPPLGSFCRKARRRLRSEMPALTAQRTRVRLPPPPPILTRSRAEVGRGEASAGRVGRCRAAVAGPLSDTWPHTWQPDSDCRGPASQEVRANTAQVQFHVVDPLSASLPRRFLHCGHLLRAVRDAGQNRSHHDAPADARLPQLGEGVESFARMRCTRLGSTPDVLVESCHRE